MSGLGQQRRIADRYRLESRLGRGGMGTVWRAYDELLGRRVAVKEIHVDAGATPHSSLREARAVARVHHPNVICVHDVVEEDGTPYIVMELVEGLSLAELLAVRGPVDAPEAARIGLALLGALRAAHALGVLHRDLKPANVLLEDGTGRVVLTDFGIAHLAGATTLTEAGMFVGSPEYTAPERMQGALAGPETDLWSLGALLCAALTGQSPFHRDSLGGVLHAVVEEEVRPPAAAGPLMPLVRGLLERDPERRIGAAEAERLLRAYAATGTTPLYEPPPRAGRPPEPGHARARDEAEDGSERPRSRWSHRSQRSQRSQRARDAQRSRGTEGPPARGAEGSEGPEGPEGSEGRQRSELLHWPHRPFRQAPGGSGGSGRSGGSGGSAVAPGSGGSPSTPGTSASDASRDTSPSSPSSATEASDASDASDAAPGRTGSSDPADAAPAPPSPAGSATTAATTPSAPTIPPASATPFPPPHSGVTRPTPTASRTGPLRTPVVAASVLAAAAALAGAGAAGVLVLRDDPGDTGGGSAGPPVATVTAPPQRPQDSPTPAPSPDPSRSTPVPAGYRAVSDPEGFSLVVPEGYLRSTDGQRVYYVSPDQAYRIGIRVRRPVEGGPLAAMRRADANGPAANPGYRDAKVTPTTHNGLSAALREFTWNGFADGQGPRRTYDICWDEGGRLYSVWVSAPLTRLDELKRHFDTVLDSFRVRHA